MSYLAAFVSLMFAGLVLVIAVASFVVPVVERVGAALQAVGS